MSQWEFSTKNQHGLDGEWSHLLFQTDLGVYVYRSQKGEEQVGKMIANICLY